MRKMVGFGHLSCVCEMDKSRLDQILRELDTIHKSKVQLLYDINLLEEFKKGPAQEAHLSIVNLLNWIRGDLENIRDLTRTLAEIIRPVHPDFQVKRKRDDWIWTERGQR